MNLCYVDVLGFHVGHLVGFLCRRLCCFDRGEAVAFMKQEGVLGLAGPDYLDTVVGQFLGELGFGEYQAAGSVCDEGAVVEFERPAHGP